jgi:hypothetical protein
MPHPSCTRAPYRKKGDLALKVKFVIAQDGALVVAAAISEFNALYNLGRFGDKCSG